MKPFDPYRLNAAHVLDRRTFAISFSNKEYDDIYSYILTYEGPHEQPWSRFDVPRNVNRVTGRFGQDGLPLFYALSDEGDLYTLPAGNVAPFKIKIEGAGVYSEDATGLGYVNSMALIGEALFVTGSHSQLYQVTGAAARWFQKGNLPQTPDTYDYLSFGKIAGTVEKDIYMAVSYHPTSTNRPLTEEEENLARELFRQGRNDEALAIHHAAEGPSRVIEGRLYHWNGAEWMEIVKPRSGKYYPEPATLSDIFIESQDKIWAVGGNGVILVGNARDGFQDVSFRGNSENLRSITKFGDRMVIASDYALHWFDGHMLSPLKPVLDPRINKNVPNPVKVQAVDDTLFYFDSKHGVHTFDGERWIQIEFPPELLEREFRGLSKPK